MRAGDTFLNQHAFFSGGECPYLKANYTAGVSRLRSGSEVRQRARQRQIEASRGFGGRRAPFRRPEADSTTACYLTRGASGRMARLEPSARPKPAREAKSARVVVELSGRRVSSSEPFGAHREDPRPGPASSVEACAFADRTPCSSPWTARSQADLLRCLGVKRRSVLASWSTASGAARKAKNCSSAPLCAPLRRLGEGDALEKIDIAHHYWRTDRALGLYYSSGAGAPPGRKRWRTRGWLVGPAEEPRPFRGTPLVGSITLLFEVELPGRDAAAPSGGSEPTG
ncbi:hypothetical protein Q5P01_001012 [Channa striata]|uniref:Uncharacterized protein n=1 Tax=Channa striata TaxID=64152 RepID=A0AA88ILF0_CHASR|nr:hypothetical protein Q5P01_001012 [Channa striata]